jgi:subtilisin family serine protease
VVAVLDTGLRAHHWLDVEAKAGGGYQTTAGGFTAVDHDIQKAIYVAGELAATSGDWPREVIRHPWDTPVVTDPLVGELAAATGHGTFIAGIVRQVAPDAQVLAVRIMHSDDFAYEGDILCALSQLAKRIAHAESGDLAAMVDVVSLSFGYFSESACDAACSFSLWQAIKLLLGMGVVVVAAAGNNSTSRMFYPAAFAQQPTQAGQVPVISVGALNPNGSKAVFSDGGRWITAWAVGAAVVSTFPTDINGSRSPELRMRAHPANQLPPGASLRGEREALDPDDYSDGFAVWSGTSFSAPLVAAHVIRSLLDGAASAVPGLRLDGPGQSAATNRAVAALQNLGWRG